MSSSEVYAQTPFSNTAFDTSSSSEKSRATTSSTTTTTNTNIDTGNIDTDTITYGDAIATFMALLFFYNAMFTNWKDCTGKSVGQYDPMVDIEGENDGS